MLTLAFLMSTTCLTSCGFSQSLGDTSDIDESYLPKYSKQSSSVSEWGTSDDYTCPTGYNLTPPTLSNLSSSYASQFVASDLYNFRACIHHSDSKRILIIPGTIATTSASSGSSLGFSLVDSSGDSTSFSTGRALCLFPTQYDETKTSLSISGTANDIETTSQCTDYSSEFGGYLFYFPDETFNSAYVTPDDYRYPVHTYITTFVLQGPLSFSWGKF